MLFEELLLALNNSCLLQQIWTGVFPAKILTSQKTVSESSDLYITCSTLGTKTPPGQGFMHLCKDGRVVSRKQQKSNQNDAVFIISVGLHNSGNYSCMYAAKELALSTATSTGLNVIPIRVIGTELHPSERRSAPPRSVPPLMSSLCFAASFHPADISVAGPPAVSEGDDLKLTCSVSGALQTLAGCPLIPSYLMRNGSVEQIKAFSVASMEVNFTIKDAALRDSGHYSCVVLPSKCTRAEGEMAPCGNNKVFVEVKGERSPRRVQHQAHKSRHCFVKPCLLLWIPGVSFDRQSVIFGVIIGVLSVALGVSFFRKGQTAGKIRKRSQETMLENVFVCLSWIIHLVMFFVKCVILYEDR